jgi:hypothetical protein
MFFVYKSTNCMVGSWMTLDPKFGDKHIFLDAKLLLLMIITRTKKGLAKAAFACS